METTGMPEGVTILEETLGSLRQIAGKQQSSVKIEKVVLGLFFTGVKLSNGHGAICYTPVKAAPEAVCCPSSGRAMPAPGKFANRNAFEIAEESLAGTPLHRAVGVAVINALSATYFEQACSAGDAQGSFVLQSGDPIDHLTLPESAYVVVVGAFVPYLQLLKARGKPFCVLEQDPATLKPDEMPFYAPAEMAAEKVPKADILVATGTTLVNGTLEELLALARPDAYVIVVGPTASMLPGAFFRRGVNVVAGIRVTDSDSLLNVLAEGGSGYHFFGKYAEKISLVRTGSQ